MSTAAISDFGNGSCQIRSGGDIDVVLSTAAEDCLALVGAYVDADDTETLGMRKLHHHVAHPTSGSHDDHTDVSFDRGYDQADTPLTRLQSRRLQRGIGRSTAAHCRQF